LPHKNIGVGLRLDAGGRQSVDVGDGAAIEQSAFGSYSLKGEYYPLPKETFRPYGGLSLGRYSIAKQSVGSSATGTGISQAGGTFNGLGAYLGVDVGRFRLSASHHMLLNSEFEVMQTVGTVDQQVKLNQNYSTIEVGFRFGG
jgi:outer membrane protein W